MYVYGMDGRQCEEQLIRQALHKMVLVLYYRIVYFLTRLDRSEIINLILSTGVGVRKIVYL